MTSEKSNNNNWKIKLEDADALQEYTLQNKNASWESLYNKLHKKQRPKFLWYWMAAACLITIIAVGVFIYHPANNNMAIKNPLKTEQQQNAVTQQPSQQSAIQKINKHELAKVKSINANINKPIKHVTDKNEIIIIDSFVLNLDELTNIKTDLPVLKDSIIQTTAIVIASKKMKIVHANELDDDGSNINMVQSRIPSRTKFLNQDIYTDYTLSTPGLGFTIPKHKGSPSN